MATQTDFASRIAKMSKEELIHNCAREISRMRDELKMKDDQLLQITRNQEIDKRAADRLIQQARIEAEDMIRTARESAEQLTSEANGILEQSKAKAHETIVEAETEANNKMNEANEYAAQIVADKINNAKMEITELQTTRNDTRDKVEHTLKGTLGLLESYEQKMNAHMSEISTVRHDITTAIDNIAAENFEDYIEPDNKEAEEIANYDEDDLNILQTTMEPHSQNIEAEDYNPSSDYANLGISFDYADEPNEETQPSWQDKGQEEANTESKKNGIDFISIPSTKETDSMQDDTFASFASMFDDGDFDPDSAVSFTGEFDISNTPLVGHGDDDFSMDATVEDKKNRATVTIPKKRKNKEIGWFQG